MTNHRIALGPIRIDGDEIFWRAAKAPSVDAPKLTAIGKTPAEAIGELVFGAPELFNIARADLGGWNSLENTPTRDTEMAAELAERARYAIEKWQGGLTR